MSRTSASSFQLQQQQQLCRSEPPAKERHADNRVQHSLNNLQSPHEIQRCEQVLHLQRREKHTSNSRSRIIILALVSELYDMEKRRREAYMLGAAVGALASESGYGLIWRQQLRSKSCLLLKRMTSMRARAAAGG
jgi:hypothetical protein